MELVKAAKIDTLGPVTEDKSLAGFMDGLDDQLKDLTTEMREKQKSQTYLVTAIAKNIEGLTGYPMNAQMSPYDIYKIALKACEAYDKEKIK